MVQHLGSGQCGAHVVRAPPSVELGAPCPQSRDQAGEGRVGGPNIMGGPEQGDHALRFGLPTLTKQPASPWIDKNVEKYVAVLDGERVEVGQQRGLLVPGEDVPAQPGNIGRVRQAFYQAPQWGRRNFPGKGWASLAMGKHVQVGVFDLVQPQRPRQRIDGGRGGCDRPSLLQLAGDAARWCALGVALVPYGGFLAAGLRAGETVLVSSATGNFGSAAVAVALAMGAARVVAPGRNEVALEDVARRFGPRLRPYNRLTGEEAADCRGMQTAASGPVDCVLDIMPPSVGMGVVRAALMTVRPYGRVVLMGGVGMLGGSDLALPYPWIMRNCITIHGQWMYPRAAVPWLAALAQSGVLDFGQYEVMEFGLDHANEAVAHAAANGGPFRMTVVRL